MTRRAGAFQQRTIRRRVTVLLSVAVTAALCLGYVAGDLYDVLPGVLTLNEVERVTTAEPRTVMSASKVVGNLDSSIVVDATAARRLIDEFAATEGIGGDYSIAMCGFNFDVSPDPGFTLTSTASCNYTRYRSNDMNDLITQLRKSYTADSYKNAMSLIQDQFEQDQPYTCLYWRSAVLLSRETFTDVRDVRELEMLRGIENYGN